MKTLSVRRELVQYVVVAERGLLYLNYVIYHRISVVELVLIIDISLSSKEKMLLLFFRILSVQSLHAAGQ